MESSPINQRIRLFIKTKGLTVQQFEKDCGFSNGYVRSIRTMPGADKLETIIRLFPDLNREWLLTGEGEMLVTPDGGSSKAPEVSPTVAELIATIGKQADIIKAQQETIKAQQESILELTKQLSK